jgi:hypothetical protein
VPFCAVLVIPGLVQKLVVIVITCESELGATVSVSAVSWLTVWTTWMALVLVFALQCLQHVLYPAIYRAARAARIDMSPEPVLPPLSLLPPCQRCPPV